MLARLGHVIGWAANGVAVLILSLILLGLSRTPSPIVEGTPANVRMPGGTIVRNVPPGISQDEIKEAIESHPKTPGFTETSQGEIINTGDITRDINSMLAARARGETLTFYLDFNDLGILERRGWRRQQAIENSEFVAVIAFLVFLFGRATRYILSGK